ncbi:hypothetical protein SNE40_014281 [Patella caerulea]|uniref:Uncharacterized protein n=1 Tax=Patella caerulea TaxID=87958 RepID=A0AAN8PSP8_PATCE
MSAYMSEEIVQVSEFIANLPVRCDTRQALVRSGILDEILEKYLSLKAQVLSGNMGLSPKYWMSYVDMIDQLADMNTLANQLTRLRPSQILRSEKTTRNIMETIIQYFITPFDNTLSPDLLYNLVSVKPLEQTAADSFLSCYQRGLDQVAKLADRISKKDGALAFFDPIARVPWKSFQDGVTKSKVKSGNGKVKDIALQRDILGILAAKSAELEKPIDFQTALTSNEASSGNGFVYILDVIAQIRAMVNVPGTFRQLTRRLLERHPARPGTKLFT